MRSKEVAQLLVDLGVEKSHSRPYVSNDNPFSEAAFTTAKYHPSTPERFSSLEEERLRRCRFIVGRELLEAELTRRVCERLGDSMGEANADAHLRAVIPG